MTTASEATSRRSADRQRASPLEFKDGAPSKTTSGQGLRQPRLHLRLRHSATSESRRRAARTTARDLEKVRSAVAFLEKLGRKTQHQPLIPALRGK